MHYRTNYLSKVILRLDFPTRPIGALNSPSEFSARIAGAFPHATTRSIANFQFAVDVQGAPASPVVQTGNLLEHTKEPNGTVKASLTTTFLTLEYNAGGYTSFEDFIVDVRVLCSAFSDCFPNTKVDRIGLRYINELTGQGGLFDWDGKIAAPVLAATKASSKAGTRLLRSVNQTVMRQDDDMATVHTGIWNPDFPNPAVRKHFVIDIDCTRENLEQGADVVDCVRTLNTLATDIFESSIEQNLRDEMGIIND